MIQVVADACFCGAWILNDEHSQDADALLENILSEKVELIVPCLWYYEMHNMLRSAYQSKRITKSEINKATTALNLVPISKSDTPSQESLSRSLNLALAHKLSIYDATYLELSQRLNIKLYTADKALLKLG